MTPYRKPEPEPERLQVSADAVAASAKCPRNCSCLNGDRGCLCTVEQTVGERYVFVKGSSRHHCPYCMLFGASAFICTCPVRNEIYRRHGV